MRQDKKVAGGRIAFVLARRIGEANLHRRSGSTSAQLSPAWRSQ
jgi:3-dehydroquinate synthetase